MPPTEVVKQGQWGICGFVCVLNALNQRGGYKLFGKDLTAAQIDAHIGPEIITYLRLTEVENPALAAKIVSFTVSFGKPYSEFNTIKKLCDEIAKHVKAGTPDKTPGFGVGMPIEAVVDYVTKHVGLKAAATTKTEELTPATLLAHKDTIGGIGDGKLQHWIYVNKDGVLMNWSNAYPLTDKVKAQEGVAPLTTAYKKIVCCVKLS